MQAASQKQPKRFDNPFDPEMREELVQEILTLEPFSRISANRFPSHLSLESILRNDVREVFYNSGDLIFRSGDYGSSAMFILGGNVRVVLGKGLPNDQLGRVKTRKKNTWQAFKQLFESKLPESFYTQPNQDLFLTRTGTHNTRVALNHVPKILKKFPTAQLGQGQLFGEIAALSRTPRNATVFAENPVRLLEIRWQGIRDIRKYAPSFRAHVDKLYRERSLETHLKQTTIFKNVPPDSMEQLVEATSLESFGDFEWYPDYKKVATSSAANRLDHEPIIVEEGDVPNYLILIRAGFARMSQRLNNGHRTIGYLNAGDVFGLDEIAHNFRNDSSVGYQCTLRAVGYLDALLIPAGTAEMHVLKHFTDREWPKPISKEKQANPYNDGSGEALFDFLVDSGFNNGSAAMVIDLNKCTGCDDCVRACAHAHHQNPRFVRKGTQFGSMMIAHACMHCEDPICTIGCPTGAIYRRTKSREIVINSQTCIGCTSCSNNCPYDNIFMVPVRDPDGDFQFSENFQPILKATKCDLCSDQITGPACQSACPHGALTRRDLRDYRKLEGLSE